MRHLYAQDERYFTIEEIVEQAIEEWGLEPVDRCSICDRPLDEERTIPICPRCESTARAHAHYFPEGPEAFKERGAQP